MHRPQRTDTTSQTSFTRPGQVNYRFPSPSSPSPPVFLTTSKSPLSSSSSSPSSTTINPSSIESSTVITITLPPGSPWTSGPHWHETHTEYLRVIQGVAQITLNGETALYRATDGVVTVPRFCIHEWRRPIPSSSSSSSSPSSTTTTERRHRAESDTNGEIRVISNASTSIGTSTGPTSGEGAIEEQDDGEEEGGGEKCRCQNHRPDVDLDLDTEVNIDLIVQEWTFPADGQKEVFFRNLNSVIIERGQQQQQQQVGTANFEAAPDQTTEGQDQHDRRIRGRNPNFVRSLPFLSMPMLMMLKQVKVGWHDVLFTIQLFMIFRECDNWPAFLASGSGRNKPARDNYTFGRLFDVVSWWSNWAITHSILFFASCLGSIVGLRSWYEEFTPRRLRKALS